MSARKASLVHLYMNLCVRTPILVIALSAVIFAILYNLAVVSTMEVYSSHKGELVSGKNGIIRVQAAIDGRESVEVGLHDRAYWYYDKNRAVYQAEIIDVVKTEGRNVVVLETRSGDVADADRGGNGDAVTVELATGEERLLDRLMAKGEK
ncbi:hypothetical protein D3C81_186900 [compost metagenome]